MSTTWEPSVAPAAGIAPGAARQSLAVWVIVGALLFNFLLCFVNTNISAVREPHVIAVEVALVALAFGLIWDRSNTAYVVLFAVVSYLLFLMAARSQFDAKILRDLLIPLIFFFLGRHLGSLRSADRLVAVCLGLVLLVGLIEWAGLSTYLRYFDVLRYYVSRGTVQDASAGGLEQGLFISGMRFEGRTLLPALGEHRVSSVFLEPVSVGNFGAIAFAWVLLRDLARPRAFAMKALAIAAILVLGDARFGAYLCAITVALYAVAPLVRPVMIYVAPALAIIALALHAQSMGAVSWENDIQGRFLLAGQVMTSLDAWQVLGLEGTTLYMADSGYAYVLAQFGLVGCAGLWALFAFLRAPDAAAERFKLFVAFYVVFGLCISTSLFTIKTAALLWFLYGTVSAARSGDAAPFAPR